MSSLSIFALRACRQLGAAAQGLAELATAVACALAQSGSQHSWTLTQVMSGCSALNSCVELACRLAHLPSQTAFKLGAACSLVFGPGRAALDVCFAAAAGSHSNPEAAGVLAGFAATQLASVMSLVSHVLEPGRQPQAAAAFASSTARPSTLLPWLSALTQAVSAALDSCDEGELVAAVLASRLEFALTLFACCHVQTHGWRSLTTIWPCCTHCWKPMPGPSTALPLLLMQPCSGPLRTLCCSSACLPQRRQWWKADCQQACLRGQAAMPQACCSLRRFCCSTTAWSQP